MGSGADFEARDRRAASNFAAAVRDAGVERTVYLGGLGEEGGDLSAHLQSRHEVEAILAGGDYTLTTLGRHRRRTGIGGVRHRPPDRLPSPGARDPLVGLHALPAHRRDRRRSLPRGRPRSP